jgi:ribose 5-phosphate isomerase B
MDYTESMKVYLGADHRGFDLKEKLKVYLAGEGYECEDLGAATLNSEDDYVDFAAKVAEEVVRNPETRGILACGSGAGVDIVANKFDGVRSVLASLPEEARAAREDDDVNILALASDFLNQSEAEAISKIFLETEFKGEERHKRRLNKISEIEKKN